MSNVELTITCVTSTFLAMLLLQLCMCNCKIRIWLDVGKDKVFMKFIICIWPYVSFWCVKNGNYTYASNLYNLCHAIFLFVKMANICMEFLYYAILALSQLRICRPSPSPSLLIRVSWIMGRVLHSMGKIIWKFSDFYFMSYG